MLIDKDGHVGQYAIEHDQIPPDDPGSVVTIVGHL